MSTPGNGKAAKGTSCRSNRRRSRPRSPASPATPPSILPRADALNFNQALTAANSLANAINSLAAFGAGNTVTVCRLNAVTYFLQVPPAGGTVQTPRLMRQVNGLNAVPVADNIINLQFSYDVINSSGRAP